MQTTIKSQKAVVEKPQLINLVSDMQGVSGIKLVKNASVFRKDGVFYARHYETIIFAYDEKSGRIEVDWHCSTTSDRQIRYCLKFFGLEAKDTIDIHEGSKWNYSGALV